MYFVLQTKYFVGANRVFRFSYFGISVFFYLVFEARVFLRYFRWNRRFEFFGYSQINDVATNRSTSNTTRVCGRFKCLRSFLSFLIFFSFSRVFTNFSLHVHLFSQMSRKNTMQNIINFFSVSPNWTGRAI